MIRPTYLLTLLLALFLTACGGSGDVVSETTTDDTTTDDTTDTTTDDETTVDTDVSLGSGEGTEFTEGELSLSASYVLLGESITITAYAVDKNDSNAAVTDSYWVEFQSECVDDSYARFSTTQTYFTGSVESAYTNMGCTVEDTVTVSLYASSSSTSAVATATSTLPVISPVLGTGEGAEFELEVISGETDLVDEVSTQLSVNAVDPEDSNALISSSRYRILWSSDCSSGSFSIASATTASGEVTTTYTGNLSSCAGDNEITADLVLASDTSTVISSATATVNISESGTSDVDPSIGTGTGADFFEGQLTLSDQQVLMGQTLTVSADGVDKNDANAQLTTEYKYVFSSDCSELATPQASFTITETNTSSNSVTSTYRNLACSGEDTIQVALFTASADPDTATPLAIATQTVDVAAPALGYGEGSSFEEGTVDGEVELAGEDESEFTANLVNPLDSNSLVTSTSYTAEWASSCSDDSFSVQKQTLSTGEINTRYITDTTNCLGTNTISLILYGSNAKGSCSFLAPANCMDSLTFDVEVTQGLDPALGYVDDSGTYYDGELLVYGYRESEYASMDATALEEATLSARGTALIEVSVVDLNNSSAIISGTSYGFVITSNCVDDGIASFEESEKITSSGSVTFTYTSDTCESDEFEVELYRVSEGAMTTRITDTSASGVIYIHSIEIGAISYEGASDTEISIATIGDAVLPKQSTLTFLVVDASGDPVVSKTVTFELTNTAGGTSLSQASDVTDSSGEVNVIINAGTAQAITSVKATTLASDGVTEISTYSQPISITTGLADQNSFELVVDLRNPGAFDYSGTEVNVTVFAADANQNPVADGTIINFTAESGSIGGTCETSEGTCSVTWVSSGTRPGNFDSSLSRVNEIDPETGATVYGMTTIMAYTSGEAGFTDSNGNGQFDDGEPYTLYGEAFRDDDGLLDVFRDSTTTGSTGDSDGYQTVEFFADFDSDTARNEAPASGYQGVTCSDTAIGLGHCASMMHVRDSVQIVQSVATVAPLMSLWVYDGTDFVNVASTYIEALMAASTSATFYVLLQDTNGNIPANGTSLAVSGDGYEIYGESGDVGNSLGLLDPNNVSALPTFGRLYTVQYAEDTDPVSIEITATYEELSVGVTLFK